MTWQAGVVPFDGDEINRETALRWLGDLWEILAVTQGGMIDEDQGVRAAFGRLLRELGGFTEAIRSALEDGEVFRILDDLDEEQRQAGAVVLEHTLRAWGRLVGPSSDTCGAFECPSAAWASLARRLATTRSAA